MVVNGVMFSKVLVKSGDAICSTSASSTDAKQEGGLSSAVTEEKKPLVCSGPGPGPDVAIYLFIVSSNVGIWV